MSDWQIGDLAVCVDASPDFRGVPVPLAEGTVYRVQDIPYCPYGPGLNLHGVERWPWGYAVKRFRKIRPDEHNACEAEFVTLLKRSRKTVRA